MLRVHDIQETESVKLGGIGCRIFLNALASCLRQNAHSAEISEQQDTALALGKMTWQEMPPPVIEEDFNCILALVSWAS